MASTKKAKLSKRFSQVNEDYFDKDGGNINKSRLKKRKLSDALGSQWSKEELEHFYEAYRKYGRDWKKVASAVRNRSVDMVEAVYNMNKAYLSLAEGTATVAGLIAMMTDHYNMLEGSGSDRESNDGLGTSHKRHRGKFHQNTLKGSNGSSLDQSQCQPISSAYGCLSLLKKHSSGGGQPRAVGKRTPRFPILHPHVKEDGGKIVPTMQCTGSDLDASVDDVALAVALTLAEASKREGSPQVSRTSSKRSERSSAVQNGEMKCSESEMVSAKANGAATDKDCLEGIVGNREPENGDLNRDNSYLLDTEATSAVKVRQKVKKYGGKRQRDQGIESNHFDDSREACSEIEEGLTLAAVKDEIDTKATNGKVNRSSPQGPRKKRGQLSFRDGCFSLDALHALADLSLSANILSPAATVNFESSVQIENVDLGAKPNIPGSISTNYKRDNSGNKLKDHLSMARADVSILRDAELGKDLSPEVSASSEGKQQPNVLSGKMRKRKLKSSVAKLLTPEAEAHMDSHLSESQKIEACAEGVKKSMSRSKHVGQTVPLPKQGKSVRPVELSSSTTEQRRQVADLVESSGRVSSVNQINLPTKVRSRRKMDIPKALQQKESRSSESIGNVQTDKCSHSVHHSEVDIKNKLSHCLSSRFLCRWFTYEWFYSAIDYPWFARSEFVEYLSHVGLGHIPRLTRVEWGVIRSSLGKPRRLSRQFLRKEREKLERYRESVRKHYTELRAGIRDGLATDLARPLFVGQHVIACHPRTREIHDGIVLTVERDRCRVQFDRPELGVDFVMDIDCMPSNPLENLSDALRRRNVSVDKFLVNFNELKSDNQSKQLKIEGSVKSSLSENLENVERLYLAPDAANYSLNASMKQDKCDIFNGDTTPTLSWLNRPMANSGVSDGPKRPFDLSMFLHHDSGSHVVEIVESSKWKAKTMVNAEMQERFSLKEWESALARIGEALNSASNWQSGVDSCVNEVRSYTLKDSGHCSSTFYDQASSCRSEPTTVFIASTKDNTHGGIEPHQSSELISSCVATLVMIQMCTERQYPPSEVVQMLDFAITSLQPCCSQNLPIFMEIEQYMRVVKTQMLALIPTPATILPSELSTM